MTTAQTRAEAQELGALIRETLQSEETAYVRWEPGNGTGYELVITPWEAVTSYGTTTAPMFDSQMGPGWVFVARMLSPAVYPFRLWEEDGVPHLAHPTYFEEKLGARSHEDGCALHLLFAAIVGEDPMCTWADAGVGA